MESTSFYMTVPSNASMDIFSNNTLANFRIQLPRRLYLNQRYEVALVEMQYPLRWETFSESSSYLLQCRLPVERDRFIVKKTAIPEGYYKSMDELVTGINASLRGLMLINGHPTDAIVLTEKPLKQRVQLSCQAGYSIKFSTECSHVLGMDPDLNYSGPSSWSRRSYDISRGFYSLYVYCSIVEPQIVGDIYAPPLRTVPVEGERGQHVIKTFLDPHYLQVNADEVRVIEINIKDDTGHDVPFMSGRVMCKLHFRQKTI